MSLKNCPECNCVVSNKDDVCPRCGYRLREKTQAKGKDYIVEILNDPKSLTIAMLLIAMFLLIVIFFTMHNIQIDKLHSEYSELQKKYTELQKNYSNYKAKSVSTPAPTSSPEPTPEPTEVPQEAPQQDTQVSNTQKSNKYEVLCGQPCVFSDYSVTYNSFSLSTDYNGNPAIIENYTFKNSSAEARPFFTTASVTLYQDGIELQSGYFVSGCDLSLSQTKIQQGASIDVQYAHVLRNKTSPITIEIKDWISFGGVVYKGIIPLS